MDEQRRFPRITIQKQGELLLDGADERIPVEIRCVSCDGASVDIDSESHLQPATRVRLYLPLPDGDVELPARVVWASGTHAGLHLVLADTDREAKQAFGAWIAPLTKKALAEIRNGSETDASSDDDIPSA